MEQVLGTPELLENILLGVDFVTLLTSAQRVNRQWLDLISNSPALQCALFFRPDFSPNQEPRRNPLLVSHWDFSLWLTGAKVNPKPSVLVGNASWRRMLLQQPPGQVLGVCNEFYMIHGEWTRPIFQMLGYSTIRCEYGDGIRMGHLREWTDQPVQATISCVYWDTQIRGENFSCAADEAANEEEMAKLTELEEVADALIIKTFNMEDETLRPYAASRLLSASICNRDEDRYTPIRVTEWHPSSLWNRLKGQETT
ncbi:hypothetical protein DL764_005430 [Monosporascus ibericus]|uniref:F-box domain-containing protein n=1 Tax=Monosporascus ibericus TaxID=155417 RepID=A0A4V1XAJ9_9PEZI|nr:hypothetical protein DL764_005430 [Monosporascus ibericus]